MHNLLLNIKSYFKFAHFFDQETGVTMHFYSPLPCGSQANVKKFSRNFFMVDGVAQGGATLSHQAQVRSKNISKITLLRLSVFLTDAGKGQEGLFQD